MPVVLRQNIIITEMIVTRERLLTNFACVCHGYLRICEENASTVKKSWRTLSGNVGVQTAFSHLFNTRILHHCVGVPDDTYGISLLGSRHWV